MKQRHPRFTSQSGLSLFELLIALALLAFISAALASSFSLGSRLFVKTTQIAALSDELALRSRLRGWLSAATPPSLLTGFGLGFEGQNDQLTFTTLSPTPFAPDAAGLAITVTASGETLSLTAAAFDDDGKEIANYSGLLAENVAQVTLSYYAADAPELGWQNSWTNATSLPTLVRINVAEGSRPYWPEFTVKILMGQ